MGKITFEQFKHLVRESDSDDSPYTSENFQRYLYNPNSVSGNTVILIDRSKPFNPAKFIGKGWSIEEQDERSLALTKVDISAIRLETTLRDEDNGRVDGEERLRRLKAMKCIRLDTKVFLTLWENKSLIPESWKGKHIYFDGTVLRVPGGDRCVLYLCWHDDGWHCHYCWLGFDWVALDLSAVLAD